MGACLFQKQKSCADCNKTGGCDGCSNTCNIQCSGTVNAEDFAMLINGDIAAIRNAILQNAAIV